MAHAFSAGGRGGRGGRGGGNRKAVRWTAQIFDETVIAGASDGVDIASPSDYEQSATLSASGSNLQRVVGYVTVRTAGALLQAYWMYIAIQDEDEPVNISAASAQNAIDERYLWWASGSLAANTSQTLHFDISTNRRLNNDDVRFTITNTDATASLAVVMQARALIKER